MSNREQDCNESYEFEDEQLYRDIINQIAQGMFLGRITDDNPSPFNDLTSLEQIILYEFDIDEEDIEEVKKDIKGRLLDLRGGCDMSEYDDLEL